jgi:hypothetical protein
MPRESDLRCDTWLQEFKYVNSSVLESLPSSAILDSYSGGGYVYKIRGSSKNILTDLADLKRLYWIDNNTRAVILEFSTYNANVCTYMAAFSKVFMPSTISFENYTRGQFYYIYLQFFNDFDNFLKKIL